MPAIQALEYSQKQKSKICFRNVLKYVGFRFPYVLCPVMSAPVSARNPGRVACLARTKTIVERLEFDTASLSSCAHHYDALCA